MLKKRIIFMGTPDIASFYLQYLIDLNYNVIAIYTQPPRKKGRGMKLQESPVHKIAKKKSINILSPINFNSLETHDDIISLNPDLIVVMGYGIILPENILQIPKFGCINIHLSLLPRWRGASPIEHAILNGDIKTGITIFKLVKEMDAGPIFIQKSIQIKDWMNKEDLLLKLNNLGISMLDLIIPKIFEKKIIPKEQSKDKITYANKIISEMRKINFYDDVELISNKIRAFSPKPSTWFVYNNEIIKIIKASYIKENSHPSYIINKNFHIGCKGGMICPEIVQREGKKPMILNDFLRGFKFTIGEKVNA
tara:strand:- start:3834 stop:4760 length:927 start_codon:yes stop_codon:yes gene_type:complete